MGRYLFHSVIAQTAVGPGLVLQFDSPRGYRSVSLQVTFTGSPSSVVVDLEGTLDGVNFFQLLNWPSGIPSGSIVSAGVFPVIAARANVKTLTGGSSPTVDAWFAMAPAE